MKYFSVTTEYLFKLEKGKRFIVLFLLSLPVGIAMSFANPIGALYGWLKGYTAGGDSFEDVWTFLGAVPASVSGVGIAAAFILMLFFMSVSSTVISRSLRVGVFGIKGVFRDFNEGFIPVLQAVFGYTVAVLLIKVVATALMLLAQGTSNVVLSAILSVGFLLLAYFAVASLMSIGIMYLPYMTFNGLNSFNAFTAACSGASGKTFYKMLGAVVVPMAVCFAIMFAVGVAGNRWASLVVESVLNSAIVTYYLTLAFLSYYEILGLVREDYPKDYFYYKPRRKGR